MILGDELGIGHDPGQHAAYVASWIKVLQDDPLEVFRAAAAAEKIQEFVLGLEQKRVREQEARETGSTIVVNHEQEMTGRVIAEIERAMENTAYWVDQAAADEVTQMAQSAVRSMREGAYEGALSSLEDAGELEEQIRRDKRAYLPRCGRCPESRMGNFDDQSSECEKRK